MFYYWFYLLSFVVLRRILRSANRIIIFYGILEHAKVLAVTLSHGMEKKEEKGYRGRAIKMRLGHKGHETYRNFHPARSTFVDISQPVIAFRLAHTRITDGRNGPHEISFPYLIPVPTKQREKREDA